MFEDVKFYGKNLAGYRGIDIKRKRNGAGCYTERNCQGKLHEEERDGQRLERDGGSWSSYYLRGEYSWQKE